jgi:hypothetical protein
MERHFEVIVSRAGSVVKHLSARSLKVSPAGVRGIFSVLIIARRK